MRAAREEVQVDFDYSDDQKFLKDEARKFLAARCPSSVVRGVLDDPAKSYDAGLWRAVAEQGWLGAAIPEAHGGLGLGRVELCAIAEELGRAVAPIPFASTVYVLAEAVMAHGIEAQKAAILPRIAAGELIGCLAISEGPGVITPSALQAKVEGGKLTGVKIPVTDGDAADMALVLASEGGRPGLFLVDLRVGGVKVDTLESLDPTRGVARLTFDGAVADRLGEAGQGFALAQAILDRAAVLLAFEQLGGADRCLEMAREYALGRYAFGRVIAGYQAIKHKLADMYVKNEVARSNAYYAAWALNVDAPELPTAAAAARIAASDAFWFASKESVQVHGGMGFTWDVDCHLYYRRSRQLSLVAGSPKLWKERLVSELEKKNAA
ncbi:alkylation response protein AidB-like acyl-CoA dehydrogenase [Caulobacter rhizosphaerae]|uniref:Alkylation response protein AidB-like acyl-CoA dehydrogenase n=1 Tax=Caulobacter rhizosphaerae TaxID=2010972 RepID=A0ABU1N2L4_9CAUL|nr:alkylation response protein AidB-like acyl-CoA dehydrogenase [Caulobacter rhizosphaerae]